MASPVLCCVAANFDLVKLCIMAIPIMEFQVREYKISKVLFWLGFFTKNTIFTKYWYYSYKSCLKKFFFANISPNFVGAPSFYFKIYLRILCSNSLLGKNLLNFVSLSLKFHNRGIAIKSKFYKKRGATFFHDVTRKLSPLDFTQYRSKSSSF